MGIAEGASIASLRSRTSHHASPPAGRTLLHVVQSSSIARWHDARIHPIQARTMLRSSGRSGTCKTESIAYGCTRLIQAP